MNENEFLKIAGSLEKNSEHPLADAIMEKVKEENIELPEITQFETVSGRGIKGKINDEEYFGGNIAFIQENNIDTSIISAKEDKILKQGKTILYFANRKSIIGIIAVADTIKETSYQAIQELKKRNIKVAMITGDNKVVAETIGSELNIDKIISEVLPQDKEKEVANLQKNGSKVAFVGDGINDSPAISKADVGIAIGSGTDIAIESADAVIMKDSLLDVVKAIDLSRAVIRNIKMNLFWAFFYNCIGIPVACGLFYPSFGLKLNPMIGAAAMSLSSVCVVTNALRLRRFKSKIYEKSEEENKMIKTIDIEGMQCNHCKMSVEKALNKLEGVTKVNVILEEGKAIIESNKEIDDNKIIDVITEEGFKVKHISI